MSDVEQPVLSAKRRLPSGRAVLGGLLVTLAVLGVLLASRLGDQATIRQVVVANEALAPGTVLEPQHLATIEIRLAEEVDWVSSDTSEFLGSVLLGPVDEFEFIQRANVAEGSPDAVPNGLVEVSLEVEASRAPASLSPGELVTVLATFTDEPAQTEVIGRNVTVISYSTIQDDFSTGGPTVLRLAIADGEVASDIVMASITGEISIIGVTGATDIEIPGVS